MADDKLKTELLQVLDESEKAHARGQEVLSRGSRLMQTGSDETKLAREFVEAGVVSRERMLGMKTGFQARIDAARVVTAQAAETINLYTLGSNTSSVAVSTGAADLVEHGQYARYPQLLVRANAVLGYTDELDRVRAALRRCRLDQTRLAENRSALSLVDESAEGIQKPTLPDSSAAVITLRDGINRAIVDLFNRCTGQDSGNGLEGKLRSIFRRAGRDDLPQSYFDHLCLLVEEKVKDMAAAKDKVTDRLAVLVVYKDRLRFLLAVLDGVNDAKLKP